MAPRPLKHTEHHAAPSGGIEWAVEAGDISNADRLRGWLKTMILHGSVFCDAVIFRHAHSAVLRGDDKTLSSRIDLSLRDQGFAYCSKNGTVSLKMTLSTSGAPFLFQPDNRPAIGQYRPHIIADEWNAL